MKPQDIIFVLILIGLLVWKRDSRIFATAGLICIAAAIPLFHFWIFFTAQRLVMFAYTLLTISLILNIITLYRKKNK